MTTLLKSIALALLLTFLSAPWANPVGAAPDDMIFTPRLSRWRLS